MTFLVFRKSTNTVVGWYENEEDIQYPGNAEDLQIFEQDYDPSVDYSLSLVPSEDGSELVNRFPGKSVEEQRELIEKEEADIYLEGIKEAKIQEIKSKVKNQLKDSEWKITRAKDLDLINANTNASDALFAERQLVRDRGNAHEELLNSLTTLDEINAFDANAF